MTSSRVEFAKAIKSLNNAFRYTSYTTTQPIIGDIMLERPQIHVKTVLWNFFRDKAKSSVQVKAYWLRRCFFKGTAKVSKRK